MSGYKTDYKAVSMFNFLSQLQFTNVGSLKILFTLLYRLTTMTVIKGRRGKTELLAFLMRRLWWENQDM